MAQKRGPDDNTEKYDPTKKYAKQRRRKLEYENNMKWNDYSINIPTQDNPGIKEIRDFMQALDKVSTHARTPAADCLHKSPLDMLEYLSRYPLVNDIIFTRRLDELDEVLARHFQTPILYRPRGPPQNDLDINGLLKRLSECEGRNLHVYDYSIPEASERTRETTVEEALRSFPSTVNSDPKNFLDIENQTGALYCGEKIANCDIRTKIARQQADAGKIGSTWVLNKASEFFLLSTRNAVSTIHVDNGGQLTWIKILEGRKIWYFPRCLDMTSLRLLAKAGSQSPEYYRDDWVKVELCAGDVLIMPPGCPHAVYTPDDCLAVGGQFWTAAHLGRSLDVLAIQETDPSISNEDLDDDIYAPLGKILENCGSIMTDVEKASVIASSYDASSASPQGKKTRSPRKGKEQTQQDIFRRILKEFRATHQGLIGD